ncbi:MAG TPA: hypothetical protein DCY88_18310 [Cyanobacteria bacterium UBA11372]|nr:hypothetical protein [Cyanobacteria bacterium UBA11372]
MAQQLHAQGELVQLLAVIEAYPSKKISELNQG